ncbi:hypothetical protein [Cuneatibacter caecimuris]|uniref:Uncharacterized protein n=1 Tax=Cuneatibacter caecimuris TaxID=1796618 RepID=A0A4Q7PS76_9FIRM|nr:hypothetical protein [Cuneatibacter caecimuris]RZT02978.1 hypothetical protein EV209_1111 [Cuneatibacter caecimuris]
MQEDVVLEYLIKIDGRVTKLQEEMQGSLGQLDEKVVKFQEEMQGNLDRLEGRVTKLQEDMQSMRTELSGLQERIAALEQGQEAIRQELHVLREIQQGVILEYEDRIWDSIKIIGEGHEILNEKLDRTVEECSIDEMDKLFINKIRMDTACLKKKVLLEVEEIRKQLEDWKRPAS